VINTYLLLHCKILLLGHTLNFQFIFQSSNASNTINAMISSSIFVSYYIEMKIAGSADRNGHVVVSCACVCYHEYLCLSKPQK